MHRTSLFTPLAFLFLFISLMISCKEKSRQPDKIDSQTISRFISSHVPGMIQADEPVSLRFTKSVVSDEQIGKEVDTDYYNISPKVSGKAQWEDSYTLVFKPTLMFSPESEYVISVYPAKFFTEEQQIPERLDFQFGIFPIDFEIEFDQLAPDPADKNMQRISGSIKSQLPLDAVEIEKVLTLKYKESKPVITWDHASNDRMHAFTITNIKRGNASEKLELRWNGSAVQASNTGARTLFVPGIEEFKVSGVEVTTSGERITTVSFSDMLDSDFDLKGVIRLAGSDKGIRSEVRQNQLLIFSTEQISGAFNLRIDRSLRSSDGRTLAEDVQLELAFSDIKPAVRVLGRGTIVPNSEEVIFPFEAINLNAVDVELFQIYQNNVMQFLQYQELGTNYGMEAVGRIVGLHKVVLEGSQNHSNTWGRYAIDLSKYTDLQPGAIYQVRVGFRKEYVQYNCSSDEEEVTRTESGNSQESIFRYNYNYPGFRYDQREDPCYPAYYSADHFLARNVLASNLGIIAKSGTEGNMKIEVRDLRTTEPVRDVAISVYDFQQQLIRSSSTGSTGTCEIQADRDPFFIIADRKGELGYLKLSDGMARSLSDFDVSGVRNSAGMKGYIYGERDVWRPGDTLFLNFILEEDGTTELSDHPVQFALVNPKGQKVYEKSKVNHTGPIYSFHTATSREDLTGNWRAEVKVGGATFIKGLKIETIKPNRLKILMDAPEEIEGFLPVTSFKLQSNWLHGAPANGLKAMVEMQLSPVDTKFTGFSEFEFDDPSRKFDGGVTTLFDGTLSESGSAEIKFNNDQSENMPGKMKAAFKTRVFEKGGDFSTDQFSKSYLPFESFVGIRIPNNRWGQKQLDIDISNAVEIVVLDPEGNPISGRKVSVGLYQSEWHWWYDRGGQSLAQFSSASHLGSFQKDELVTGKDGRTQIDVKPDAYGSYLIRVCDTETGHCSGSFYYAGRRWGQEDDQTAAAKLIFSSDKTEYDVGQTAELSIPTSAGSVVLISIEANDKVIESHSVKGAGELTKFKFSVSEEMLPNVYAHVTLLQKHNNGENDLPLRMYGVLPIKVSDASTLLHPEISMPNELEPEQTFEIRVNESDGKEMAYTIAVVDEGLLDLTRFQTPDPGKYFFAKEALGVKTWDVYDDVLGGYGGPIERILSIGGDGVSPEMQSVQEVNRFKPVVMHLGPYFLEAGKKATHKLKMPNYVGSVRTMVVAADNGKYGATDKTTAVKKPLMVLATLPRVLSPGEEIVVPVNVFAMDSKITDVTVRLQSNDQLQIVGASEKLIKFSSEGDQLVKFNVKVGNTLGAGRIRIEALSGKESASQEIEIGITNPNPFVSEITEKALEPGEVWSPELEQIGMLGTNEAILEMYSITPANLEERLQYLLRYPYGCLEQTTSAAFPQLYVSDLIEMSSAQKARMRQNVNAAIHKLERFIVPGGGLAYWPGQNRASEWGNSYAGHFLLEAQNAGYFIPSRLIDAWKRYQVQKASHYSGFELPDDERYGIHLQQAYRLYTLALNRTPEWGAMNRLRNEQNLSFTSKAMLAAAYALGGQKQVALSLIDNLNTQIPAYQETGYTYGSDTRDRAMIVEALIQCEKRNEAAQIVQRIAEELGSGRWYSTQTTAYGLIAIARFTRGTDEKGLNFNFSVDGQSARVVQSEKPIFQIVLNPDAENHYKFSVENLSQEPSYARVIRRGKPIEPITEDVRSHLNMSVTYTDRAGQKLDPTKLKQGTDFIATVSITNPGTLRNRIDELALEQVFPAGWEITNQRMDNLTSSVKTSSFDYQDFRDDRVSTFFDIYGNRTNTYQVPLHAAYEGRFILPPQSCEAMYDHSIRAVKAGGWVEVLSSDLEI